MKQTGFIKKKQAERIRNVKNLLFFVFFLEKKFCSYGFGYFKKEIIGSDGKGGKNKRQNKTKIGQ